MKRRFWTFLLVLGLLFGTVASFNIVKLDSKPILKEDFKPITLVSGGVDLNVNRISDGLDLEIAQRAINHTDNDPVDVVVILSREPSVSDVDGFRVAGGRVKTDLWKYALYGFGGEIPFGRVASFVDSHSDVLLVEKEAICNATLAYAAQQVGARPYVWSTLELQGDPNSAIAVLDTGIDGSHVDFAGGFGSGDFSKKIVGWNDQVNGLALPYDDSGHGSHCSGLAAGDGFFSVDESGFAEATFGADYAA